MDLGGNKLNVDVNWTGGGTGIAAIGHASKKELNGSVEIKNAGAMSVDLKTSGLSAALFANRGGKIAIHNGGGKEEDKVLKLRASSKVKGSAAVIKTMNGNRNAVTKDNTQSEITIDGLVDVLADGKADANGYAANEAVSAVASTINIGGGKIIAKMEPGQRSVLMANSFPRTMGLSISMRKTGYMDRTKKAPTPMWSRTSISANGMWFWKAMLSPTAGWEPKARSM